MHEPTRNHVIHENAFADNTDELGHAQVLPKYRRLGLMIRLDGQTAETRRISGSICQCCANKEIGCHQQR